MSLVYKDVDNLLIQLCYFRIEKAVQPRGESFDILEELNASEAVEEVARAQGDVGILYSKLLSGRIERRNVPIDRGEQK